MIYDFSLHINTVLSFECYLYFENENIQNILMYLNIYKYLKLYYIF